MSLLVLIPITPVFFLVLAGLINRLSRPRVSRLRILVLRHRIFGPWIPHKKILKKRVDIFDGLFAAGNPLIYFLEH